MRLKERQRDRERGKERHGDRERERDPVKWRDHEMERKTMRWRETTTYAMYQVIYASIFLSNST